MCSSASVCACACMRVCQRSKNQRIQVGNQMEEKSGKIKYLPHTCKIMGGGGADYNDPTYGTASCRELRAAEFAHDQRHL